MQKIIIIIKRNYFNNCYYYLIIIIIIIIIINNNNKNVKIPYATFLGMFATMNLVKNSPERCQS